MVGVTAEIDKAAVKSLDNLLAHIQSEMPRRAATETRRAAIYICQALRARTPKAPKRIRKQEYAAIPSPIPPRYIHSNSAGHHLLRRWQLTRKVGTPQQYTRQHYVYTNARRGAGGKMVGKSPAQERRELIRQHGGIPRAGLAKKSWGWIMKQIYSATAEIDIAWKRTRGERRDPRMYAKGKYHKSPTGALAIIHNALDYIAAIVPPGTIAIAINSAVKRLEHNLTKNIDRRAA